MAMQIDIKIILDEYNQRRANEETRVNNLINDLIQTYPKFKVARESYASARTKAIRAKLRGEVADISKEQKEYSKELKAASKAKNIRENDLEICYTCVDCKDTGYVGDGAKTYCNCLLNKVSSKIMSSQNILTDATFSQFDLNIFPNDKKVDKSGRTQREHISHIKDGAIKWCNDFPNTSKLQMFVLGSTGVGKSFLINCIAHSIIQKGYSVINSTASGINEAMLNVINSKDNSLINLFKSCNLLIIDDLGVEPILRNISVETLYEILEHRLLNKKHTIICTNLSLPMITQRYGHRISSRLASPRNTILMHILGDDLRRFRS